MLDLVIGRYKVCRAIYLTYEFCAVLARIGSALFIFVSLANPNIWSENNVKFAQYVELKHLVAWYTILIQKTISGDIQSNIHLNQTHVPDTFSAIISINYTSRKTLAKENNKILDLVMMGIELVQIHVKHQVYFHMDASSVDAQSFQSKNQI